MKKLSIISILFLFCITFTSCKQYFYSGSQANVAVELKYEVPIDLDIDTSKTLQGTSKTDIYIGFIKVGDKHFHDSYSQGIGEREKMAAIYKALKGTEFDILINPKYLIETRKGLLHSSITATVAGYGAKVNINPNLNLNTTNKEKLKVDFGF